MPKKLDLLTKEFVNEKGQRSEYDGSWNTGSSPIFPFKVATLLRLYQQGKDILTKGKPQPIILVNGGLMIMEGPTETEQFFNLFSLTHLNADMRLEGKEFSPEAAAQWQQLQAARASFKPVEGEFQKVDMRDKRYIDYFSSPPPADLVGVDWEGLKQTGNGHSLILRHSDERWEIYYEEGEFMQRGTDTPLRRLVLARILMQFNTPLKEMHPDWEHGPFPASEEGIASWRKLQEGKFREVGLLPLCEHPVG